MRTSNHVGETGKRHDRSLELSKAKKGKTEIKRQDDGREESVRKKTWLILLITAGLTELALCKQRQHCFLVFLTWCGCILRSKTKQGDAGRMAVTSRGLRSQSNHSPTTVNLP